MSSMMSLRAPAPGAVRAVSAGRRTRVALRPVAVAIPRKAAAARPSARTDATMVVEASTMVKAAASPPATHGVHQVTAGTYQEFLATHSGKLICFDFYTTWCGPCKMIAPELERMAGEADASKMVYAKLDCGADNDSKRLAMSLGIKALPTFHLYREAKVVDSMTGAKVKSLQELINKHL